MRTPPSGYLAELLMALHPFQDSPVTNHSSLATGSNSAVKINSLVFRRFQFNVFIGQFAMGGIYSPSQKHILIFFYCSNVVLVSEKSSHKVYNFVGGFVVGLSPPILLTGHQRMAECWEQLTTPNRMVVVRMSSEGTAFSWFEWCPFRSLHSLQKHIHSVKGLVHLKFFVVQKHQA